MPFLRLKVPMNIVYFKTKIFGQVKVILVKIFYYRKQKDYDTLYDFTETEIKLYRKMSFIMQQLNISTTT